MARLQGKAALVTGGSRGIGAAVAKRLAAEGADVAITYVRGQSPAQAVVADIKAEGRKGLAIQADAADGQAVQAAVDRAAAEFGRLDILVNNAGVFIMAPVDGDPLAAYDATFAVNVRGLYAASLAAAKHMGEGGRIIQIGSVNADRVPMPGGAVYAASKAAVQALTRGLARDLGPRGITVNDVQPGPVDTDMNPESGPFADLLKSTMAIQRYARAEEIAALVAYLASPEAAMVTGAAISIDGGFLA